MPSIAAPISDALLACGARIEGHESQRDALEAAGQHDVGALQPDALHDQIAAGAVDGPARAAAVQRIIGRWPSCAISATVSAPMSSAGAPAWIGERVLRSRRWRRR